MRAISTGRASLMISECLCCYYLLTQRRPCPKRRVREATIHLWLVHIFRKTHEKTILQLFPL